MFLPEAKVSSSPALILLSAASVDSVLSSVCSPCFAVQYVSPTILATVVALTNFLPSSPPMFSTPPLLLTLRSVVAALNFPPSLLMVVPSTLTSSL